jgi:hypothetical protein
MANTSDYIKLATPGIHSHEIVETIFAMPYTRIGDLIERGIAQRVSASRYLKQLAAIGVLAEEKHGRDKIFVHRKYMDLLGRDDHEFAPYQGTVSSGDGAPVSKRKRRTRA